MKTTEQLLQRRLGGLTERCHNIPHQGSYSVAAHSWGVAMIYHFLWPEDFPRMAMHCLSHDVPEAWLGDIPAPTKMYVKGLSQALQGLESRLNASMGLPPEAGLDPLSMSRLKAADRIELYMWCREQVAIGNRYALECQHEITRYILATEDLPPEARSLMTELMQRSDILPAQSGIVESITRERE